MKLAITIINYNSQLILSNLLKSLEKQKIPNAEIWVVDNKSPDNFRSIVKKEFPKVHFVQSEENGGFAKGQNILLKEINTELVLILNPDTIIPERAIERMVDFMVTHPDCAISSCRILGYDKQLHSNGGDFPFGMALIAWLFNLESIPFMGRLLPNFHQVSPAYYQTEHYVDWVGGTFLLARTEVLKKVGFFNEKYFMYFEDVDLCYHVIQAGHKIILNPEVTIYHKSGGTSNNPYFAQFKGELSGLMIFYQENCNFLQRLMVKGLVYMATFLRIIALTLLGRFSLAHTYLKVLAYV